jgi:hypothetical protein
MPKTLKSIGILAFFVFALSSLSFAQQVPEERITISTYYPSPYGSYNELATNTLLYGTLDSPPFECTPQREGATYYNSIDKLIYVCNGSEWVSLSGTGGTGEELWIGGVTLSGAVEESSGFNNLFTPPHKHTPYFFLGDWALRDGPDGQASHKDFYTYKFAGLTSFAVVDLTKKDKGSLTAGIYKITYGGGTLRYLKGKNFRVYLYVGGLLLDWYDLNNPAAMDAVPSNFWEGSLEIPVRDISRMFYNSRKYYIAVKLVPLTENLNWDLEIGEQYRSKSEWEETKPSFALNSGNLSGLYTCNPGMKSQYCGPNPHPDPSGQWLDFWKSNYWMRAVNTYAGGVVSGFSIDVYKE